MTHQPGISFSNSFLSPFNPPGGRTSNVRSKINMKKHHLPLLLAPTISILASCGPSVTSTESFYRPTVMQTFPPKEKDAHIPILGAIPREKHGMIGTMSFSSGKGTDFNNKCLVHNARKNGADAVIVFSQGSISAQVPFTMLGYTTYQPQTTYSNFSGSAYGTGGYARATGSGVSTTYAPVYNPGFSGVRTIVTTHTEAAFIKFYPK